MARRIREGIVKKYSRRQEENGCLPSRQVKKRKESGKERNEAIHR